MENADTGPDIQQAGRIEYDPEGILKKDRDCRVNDQRGWGSDPIEKMLILLQKHCPADY